MLCLNINILLTQLLFRILNTYILKTNLIHCIQPCKNMNKFNYGQLLWKCIPLSEPVYWWIVTLHPHIRNTALDAQSVLLNPHFSCQHLAQVQVIKFPIFYVTDLYTVSTNIIPHLLVLNSVFYFLVKTLLSEFLHQFISILQTTLRPDLALCAYICHTLYDFFKKFQRSSVH